MKKATALLLTAAIALGICGCGRIDDTKVDDLIDDGYVIAQVDDDSICISEDGVEYYYKSGLMHPVFEQAVFTVSPRPEHSDWHDRTVTIRPEGTQIYVTAEKHYITTNRDGEEVEHTDGFLFKFLWGTGFEEEDLYNTRGFADVAGDYRSFIENYLTPDELQEVYDRAKELQKELY